MMMRMTAPLAIGALWRQAQRSMVCRQLQQRWQHQGNAEKELLVQRSKNNMITTLTLNRPKANAMGKALMEQFTAAVEELEECSDTRCVILTSSSPRVFSAGADLKERAGMNLEEAEQTVTGLRNTLQRFASLPMPTIAVVEGVAVGGGLELALAADWMVASRTASFGLPETSLGIIPGAGGTQRLARLIGPARALELIATAQRFTAEAAYDYGIVQHLVEPGMGDEKALELSLQIVKNAPIAVRAAKEAVKRGVEAISMDHALEIERKCYARTLPTKDRLEGLAAFREGRDPDYKGQ